MDAKCINGSMVEWKLPKASTTSTIETNEFTVSEAAAVRINWSVCSQPAKNKDYAYYTITNTATNVTIGGTGTQEARIQGTNYGTAEASLIYVDKDILLEAGTYKVTITYSKDSDSTHQNLDKAYLKSIGVYTKSASGSEITVREKSGGFVIYEGTDAVTNTNVATAKTTRNQYVWVPVASSEVENMYKSLSKTSGALYSNYYDFSASGYPLKERSSAYEPAVVSYDVDSMASGSTSASYLKQYLEGIGREEFLEEMRQEYYNTLVSVKTYGGFYIGRYETGNISSKVPVVVKGNTTISNVQWYRMYKASKNLKGANKSVQTGLIWGIQWDETLKWIIEQNEKTVFEVGGDSTSWGNYGNSITSGAGSSEATGYSESWKANNIYDMAGNVWDWTMESNGSYGRYCRGGNYGAYDGNYPARIHISYGPATSFSSIGGRVALYVM